MQKGKTPVTSISIDKTLKTLVDLGCDELTLLEIADACGTSKQCIQQIEQRALRRFRKELAPIYKEWFDKHPYIKN